MTEELEEKIKQLVVCIDDFTCTETEINMIFEFYKKYLNLDAEGEKILQKYLQLRIKQT